MMMINDGAKLSTASSSRICRLNANSSGPSAERKARSTKGIWSDCSPGSGESNGSTSVPTALSSVN